MTPRTAGFSLLEIVVAMAILTAGISSAIALFVAATAAHKRAVDRIHVAAIAECAFADVESALAQGTSIEELLKSPPFEEIAENWPGYRVGLQILLAADGDLRRDEFLVELEVGWKSEGAERAEQFQQLVVRELER